MSADIQYVGSEEDMPFVCWSWYQVVFCFISLPVVNVKELFGQARLETPGVVGWIVKLHTAFHLVQFPMNLWQRLESSEF